MQKSLTGQGIFFLSLGQNRQKQHFYFSQHAKPYQIINVICFKISLSNQLEYSSQIVNFLKQMNVSKTYQIFQKGINSFKNCRRKLDHWIWILFFSMDDCKRYCLDQLEPQIL